MDYELKGKVAIITGGYGGLGTEVTELLLKEGCNVVVSYIVLEDEVLKWVTELNKKYKAQAFAIFNDVSDEESDKKLLEETLKKFGTVDILINNAGIWPTAFVKDMEYKAFDKTLKINLLGPFVTSKLVCNYLLKENKKGKIINLVSQAAFHGSTSGHAHYAASKAGLVGFTISLAREVAPSGITVNAIAPGIMRTPMNEDILQDKNRRDAYLDRIPLRRVAEPIEVAKVVLFLAGSQSDYMTGTTLDVTGGMLMR